MPHRKMPLRSYLLLGCVIVALVPVLIFTFWIQRSAYQQEIASVKDRHLLIARNLTGALARYALDIQAAFQDVTHNPDESVPEEQTHLLKTLGINLIAYLDMDGELVNLSFGAPHHLPFDDTRHLLHADIWRSRAAYRISSVLPCRDGTPALFVLQEREEGGYALGSIHLDYIRKVQRAVTFGKKGHAAIIDHRGQLLAHPKPAWQQQMKDISHLPPARKMMAGDTGVIQFFSPAVKADMIAGYATVTSTGWGVMIPQPISELEERAAQVRQVALGVSCVGLFMALILGWWLARTFTRPIDRTVEAATALAENHHTAHLGMPKGPMPQELDTLCRRFDQMADQVYQARISLESQVAQRTEALQKEIEQRKRLEEKLRHLASHDQLTGLPNRNLFLDRLDQALQLAGRKRHTAALLFLDIDRFKEVNDRLGHHVGDLLLQEIAARLKSAIRQADTASRYGGDEFVLLLIDSGDEMRVGQLAKKVLESIAEPITIEGKSLTISASLGIALSRGEQSPDELLHQADAAMYRAKQLGKNRYAFAPPEDRLEPV